MNENGPLFKTNGDYLRFLLRNAANFADDAVRSFEEIEKTESPSVEQTVKAIAQTMCVAALAGHQAIAKMHAHYPHLLREAGQVAMDLLPKEVFPLTDVEDHSDAA